MSNDKNVVIEDARIIFRNFSGKEGQYNREGDRSFSVVLPPDIAEKMAEDGWNVRQLNAREEGEEPTPYLQVSVSYKTRPPRVVMMTSKARTSLDEDSVEVLDWTNIAKADMILNPYAWTVNGKSGIKAYLKSLFVTVEEDELELKYSAEV